MPDHQHRGLLPDHRRRGLSALPRHRIAADVPPRLQLEEKIKEKIDADFKEQVSFQLERDLFFRYAPPSLPLPLPSAHPDDARSVISAAITLQLRALEHALDAPLGALARTQWPAQRQVSGPAPYVGDLVRAVESVVELARPAVEGKKYLRNWLDKASG